MKTGTFTNYAIKRTTEHIGRFLALNDQLRRDDIDTEMLTEAEHKYNAFKSIDYKVYSEN
jgi:1,4-alpha-glucan branching enzyme